jgi:MFS family permease
MRRGVTPLDPQRPEAPDPALAPPTGVAPAPIFPDRRAARVRTFEALRDANFRWFFAAMFGNFAAMNMQMFIRGWLVYELTGSFEALGIMSLANGVSGVLLAPVGGVLADRVRQKKHVVQIGQALNMGTVLAVGSLIAFELLVFEHLVIAAVVQGAVMNAMMPARQALTPDVVGMERLMNAVALNTSGMNAARLLMPGLAGWMVGALGDGESIAAAQYVYWVMAALYGWSILGLLRVRVDDRAVPVGGHPPPLGELASGFVYIWRTPVIRMLLGWNFLMVLCSMTYFMLLPGFAKEVLDAGPGRLGILTSISGVGSLIGSLVIASLPNRKRGLRLLQSAVLLGVSLIAFSFSTSYWLSTAILVVVGLGQAGRMSLSNVLIQSYVDDDYRGRVMSVYMLEWALTSFGIYGFGVLAQIFGPQWAVGSSAVALLITALGLLLFSRTYRQLQ